ncbi:hypothetical protein LEP1GSC047_0914 [Leptospira phage vB_LinZ_10-LE1]|nr:hypothetical protein LEP1GSC047_0914 [Leptospira phage vB_LinZ_10-LE1]
MFPNSTDILEDSKSFFKRAFFSEVGLLVLYSSLNLLITYSINYRQTITANRYYESLFNQQGISPFLYSMNTYPYVIIWVLFFILLFQIYSMTLKFWILRSFTEKNVLFIRVAGMEAVSFSNFILFLFPVLIYSKLFPNNYKSNLIPLVLYSSVYFITIFGGMLYYFKSWVRLSKEVFLQPTGRAVFVCFAPLLLLAFLILWIIS